MRKKGWIWLLMVAALFVVATLGGQWLWNVFLRMHGHS